MNAYAEPLRRRVGRAFTLSMACPRAMWWSLCPPLLSFRTQTFFRGAPDPRSMKVKLGKGYPKQTAVQHLHQLALGILGCWIDQVTGTKVKIAKAYYSAHFAHYPRNACVFWGSTTANSSTACLCTASRMPRNAGLESWRVFSKMYPRTSKTFAQVTQDTARKTYAMVHS